MSSRELRIPSFSLKNSLLSKVTPTSLFFHFLVPIWLFIRNSGTSILVSNLYSLLFIRNYLTDLSLDWKTLLTEPIGWLRLKTAFPTDEFPTIGLATMTSAPTCELPPLINRPQRRALLIIPYLRIPYNIIPYLISQSSSFPTSPLLPITPLTSSLLLASPGSLLSSINLTKARVSSCPCYYPIEYIDSFLLSETCTRKIDLFQILYFLNS